jgi:hypothetical protein
LASIIKWLFKAIEKERLQGGKGDNKEIGRPQHIHDPGIQQEPISNEQIAQELALNGSDVHQMTAQLREGIIKKSPR